MHKYSKIFKKIMIIRSIAIPDMKLSDIPDCHIFKRLKETSEDDGTGLKVLAQTLHYDYECFYKNKYASLNMPESALTMLANRAEVKFFNNNFALICELLGLYQPQHDAEFIVYTLQNIILSRMIFDNKIVQEDSDIIDDLNNIFKQGREMI